MWRKIIDDYRFHSFHFSRTLPLISAGNKIGVYGASVRFLFYIPNLCDLRK